MRGKLKSSKITKVCKKIKLNVTKSKRRKKNY